MPSGVNAHLLKVYMSQSPNSGAIDDLHLRKQTPWDRLVEWLQRRELPPVGSFRHKLLRLFDSLTFSIIIVLVTLIALYLVDICIVVTTDLRVDFGVSIVIFISFIFFLLEMIGASVVQDGYFLTFFFWCDLIGTLSLIFDIPWVSRPLGLDIGSANVSLLRASRIARVAARGTRVFRLLRSVRMPAFIRCCSSAEEEREKARKKTIEEGDELELDEEDDDDELDEVEIEARRLKREQRALAEKPLVSTNVGNKLQLVVSKRVILLVTLMIFGIPLLSETIIDRGPTVGLDMLESSIASTTDPTVPNAALTSFINAAGTPLYIDIQTTLFYPTPTEPDTSDIRRAALLTVYSSSGNSRVLYDVSDDLYVASLLSIGMTTFTIIMFAGGSLLFTHDAERLFFKPIERMIKTVKKLAVILFDMDHSSSSSGGSGGSTDSGVDETILIEAVVNRMSQLFDVRLDRDGIARKITWIKTPTSRWRISVEEETCQPIDLTQHVSSKDLMVARELDELVSVARCLDSPIASHYLALFLRDEYRLEDILFLNEVKHFRHQTEKVACQAQQVYALFVADDALNQLAVSWECRQKVGESLKRHLRGLTDLFQPIEHSILAALARDVFPRFMQSVHCLKLLKHLTLERRTQHSMPLHATPDDPFAMRTGTDHARTVSHAHTHTHPHTHSANDDPAAVSEVELQHIHRAVHAMR